MTDDYRDWQSKRKSENAQYRRYWDLMTVGFPVECPECSKPVALIPKAVGMSAGNWEVNCIDCHNATSRGLSGYTERSAYNTLEELLEDYRMNRLTHIDAAVHELAKRYDSQLPDATCHCGGSYSIAAKPRCIYCDAVVIDSYFHFPSVVEL